MQKTSHITVNGTPFCTAFLGCQAGTDMQVAVGKALGIHPVNVTCGHPSVKDAKQIAKALRPRFRRGVKVAVVTGPCPDQ